MSETEVEEAPKEKKAKSTGTSKEWMPVIRAGAWVRLGDSDEVPEEAQGALAAVMEAQILHGDGTEKDAVSPYPYEYQDDNCTFTVRTRDQGITFQCSRDAFAEVGMSGRHELVSFG